MESGVQRKQETAPNPTEQEAGTAEHRHPEKERDGTQKKAAS